MQYMEKGLGSKPLAMLFSALCVAAPLPWKYARLTRRLQMVEAGFSGISSVDRSVNGGNMRDCTARRG